MKVIPNLTFVVECFPANGSYVLRFSDGRPLYVGDSLTGVVDTIQFAIDEQSELISKHEKELVENSSIINNV